MKLSMAIGAYAQRMRAGGRMFNRGERGLMAFCRSIEDPPLNAVTQPLILTYLNGHHRGAISWHYNYSLFRNFFEFWAAREMIADPHLPPLRVAQARTFVPYIYSRLEVRTLLRATRLSQRKSLTLDAYTLRVLLLFLYATGAYLGEAIALKRKDLDLREEKLACAEMDSPEIGACQFLRISLRSCGTT